MKSIQDIDLKAIAQNREYFPSPAAWEDQVLYFLLADRFSNGKESPADLYNPQTDNGNAVKDPESEKQWLSSAEHWNGGTLKGVTSKIGYLKKMGITAIWVSPILKQASFETTYHGYGIQNFLAVDPHLGSGDDLNELVREAHKNGMYVIMDIIINHAGNVFRYKGQGPTYNGSEFEIEAFHDKDGQATISADTPDLEAAWPDGGIWPAELMTPATFSRKGSINNWDNPSEYVEGDFFSLKNINLGYGDNGSFVPSEALKILTECYKYWIASADIDGFRLDSVKHLEPGATAYFVREIHEFAATIGKNNFYIIGEITGGLGFAINTLETTGLDAALGINMIADKLENVAKGYQEPSDYLNIFKNSELLGEDEYKWYKDNVVSMFDDHDMVSQLTYKSRFCGDNNTAPLLANALFLNLMSPGIPCIYYGTEQGFDGNGGTDKFVREAMFAAEFGAFRSHGKHFFNDQSQICQELPQMIKLRHENIALRQGRVYQREISWDGENFALPHKAGEGRYTGIIAWSRILSTDEIILAINCDIEKAQTVYIAIDSELHAPDAEFEYIYSSDHAQQSTKIKLQQIAGKNVLQISVPPAGAVALR